MMYLRSHRAMAPVQHEENPAKPAKTTATYSEAGLHLLAAAALATLKQQAAAAHDAPSSLSPVIRGDETSSHADARAAAMMAARATQLPALFAVPPHSVSASPYIRQLEGYISHLCTDAPTNVVTEVLEILSTICEDLSMMRRTERVNNNAPAGTTALDLMQTETEANEAMVDARDDPQDVEMEIDVKPGRFDVSNDRTAHDIRPTHGKPQPTYAMSDTRRTDVPQRVARVNPPRRAKDKSVLGGPRSRGTSSPGQLHAPSPASTVPTTPSQQLVDLSSTLEVGEMYTRLGIPDLYRRSFDLLNGRRITRSPHYKSFGSVMLTPGAAYEIVQVFFSKMVCTTHERIEDIVRTIKTYNTGCRADITRADTSAPQAIREFLESVSAIATPETPGALRSLTQNICYVRLHDS
ncbi:uncharacterized protein B0T15DRAFT_72876 [Chaetomium strumarium]|uniref:Uncharacterized protein n=1 Tax=Chaetomium strumarium TaxID=1170767 RepID=A0AAJ0H3Y5_9PEZI|nr:hypothetical protein B0T15DRAFT_72876 [Chaetomium strumarium]